MGQAQAHQAQAATHVTTLLGDHQQGVQPFKPERATIARLTTPPRNHGASPHGGVSGSRSASRRLRVTAPMGLSVNCPEVTCPAAYVRRIARLFTSGASEGLSLIAARRATLL